MKINIKYLAAFIVLLNTLTIMNELPSALIAFVFTMVLFSFLISNKVLRDICKIIFLMTGIVLIRLHFKAFLVTEAGVSFVLVLASLKLWELENENDHFNMFLILALLESCLFLLSPTFGTFFLGFFKIILFFFFILKIRNYDLSLISGKRLIYLVAPSLLLALILFYTFPRFTQGFISRTSNQILFSGTSSQINIKNLGSLNLSKKIVFKVHGLNSKILPIPLLYWRENILWDYYKEEWISGFTNLKSEQHSIPKSAETYTVELSQEYNEFLPILDGTTYISKSNLDFNYYSEGSYRLKNISKTSALYEANTNYKNNLKELNFLMEKKGLRLSSSKKDQIKKLILVEVENFDSYTDEQKLDLAIEFFKNRHFEYSLSPPFYKSIEDFILHGKSGYCSHFAPAFAYIARTIGLPARIVSGYQGGEYNPFDHSIVVRELDGHAWVEVYLKKIGWYRYDPTALVAPGRIELGANDFFNKLDPNINFYIFQIPKSLLNYEFINRTSLWVDSISSKLNSVISTFDKESQQQFLSKILPRSISTGWIFAISLSSSMPIFWFLFSRIFKVKIEPEERRYRKFQKKMKKNGVEKELSESATHYGQRCQKHFPQLNAYITTETNNYVRKYYRKNES